MATLPAYLEDRQNKLIELAFNNIENKNPEKDIQIITQMNNEGQIFSSKFLRSIIYFIKFLNFVSKIPKYTLIILLKARFVRYF